MLTSGKASFARLTRFLRRPGMKYETELYSVLLLIALFLVLVNLISIRVVSQLRNVFEDQIYADLHKVARQSVVFLSDRPKLTSSTTDWQEFLNRSYADSIEVIEIDAPGFVSIPSFAGRLTTEQMETLHEGEPLTVEPDRKSFAPGYVVLFPFETKDGRGFILRLYKRADSYGVVEKVARFNSLFHLSTLLAVVLLGYLYLRVTLKPYQAMKHAAQEATPTPKEREVSVEQIVTSFQKMVKELKDKEAILQGLYQKTQKRAARLEQFNEYILAGMGSGLISCNREEIITHFNRSAQKLLGVGEQQALGKHYSEVLSHVPDLIELIARTTYNKANSSRCELNVDAGDGEEKSLGVSTTLISDELGRRVGVTVIMTDLTEIKRLQKDIAYKDKMAALGETAAGLAHELRNSMTAVVGFGKLITKLAQDNPEMLQVAESISREGSATEQMLTRFLAFAQPTSFSMDRVDVAQTARDLAESLQSKAETRGITLECSRSSDSCSVWGDPLAIRQIVSNLLVNAVEASPHGGRVQIDIESSRDDELVAILVSDDGPGIPDNLRHKVFNPFFTTKEGGTGLGLCTVHKFVTGMSGRVELSPADEDGLTVKVFLPKAAVTEPAFDSDPSGQQDSVELTRRQIAL
jgi:PAS domain S-box-containing protein